MRTDRGPGRSRGRRYSRPDMNGQRSSLPERESQQSLVSRSDLRRANRELEDTLARLSSELVELKPRLLEKLELPEVVLDTVLDTQAIASHTARNRQLRLVRAALRDADWSLIRARLDALLKSGSIPASLEGGSDSGRARAAEWVTRLVGEGTPALDELMSFSPTADRVHLRNLIRQVSKQEGDRRKRAEEKLAAAVAGLLR
jgi:ribosome-associated protein